MILYTLLREVQCSLYVDDFAIWHSYFNEKKSQKVLQAAIDSIISWTSSHGFTISRSKTVAITFTRKYRTVKPSLLLYGQPIIYVNHTKFLGLHFDEKMTWKYHIESVREKCGKVLCLLKRLSHTRWEADRSTLVYLHQTLVLSKIDYGSHLYASGSKSFLKKLHSVHHNGLRIATGAFRSSPVISLYVEIGFCSLSQRREEYGLNYYSGLLRSRSKILRLVNGINSASDVKPQILYSFVTRLRGFLDNHDIPPLNVIKHSPYNFPFWNLIRAKCCKEMFTADKNQIPCDSIKQIFLEHKQSHNDCPFIQMDQKMTMG